MLYGHHIRGLIRRRTGPSRFQGITYGLWAKGCYTETRRGQESYTETIYTLFGRKEKSMMKPRIVGLLLLVMFLAGCATTEQQQKRARTPTATGDTFVGKWMEYWPDIPQHATHVITKHGDQYEIEGASPLTKKYAISNVRMEGDYLKFSEGTATFTVEYELRVKDRRTLSVRARGRSGWRTDIVWKRVQ